MAVWLRLCGACGCVTLWMSLVFVYTHVLVSVVSLNSHPCSGFHTQTLTQHNTPQTRSTTREYREVARWCLGLSRTLLHRAYIKAQTPTNCVQASHSRFGRNSNRATATRVYTHARTQTRTHAGLQISQQSHTTVTGLLCCYEVHDIPVRWWKVKFLAAKGVVGGVSSKVKMRHCWRCSRGPPSGNSGKRASEARSF